MRVVITTSDDYIHLLPGFAHQWNKYAQLPVTVVWRNVEPPPLPENFTMVSSPARMFAWTESLSSYLKTVDDEVILLGLEDYWLAGAVDDEQLAAHVGYLERHEDVVRIDLTEDRSAFPFVERDGYFQAILTPDAVQYALSTQFSLWRRTFLIHALDSLQPAGIPPQFEVEASRVVAKEQPIILGTGYRVIPCHGDGVVWNGRTAKEHLHLEYLPVGDVLELKALGYA